MASNLMRLVSRALKGNQLLRLTTKEQCTASSFGSLLNTIERYSIKTRCQFSQGYRRNFPELDPRTFCFGGVLAFLGLEKPKPDAIEDTIKHGILALQRKEYKKAEQFLHIALKMSQDALDENAVTYCYDVMANIAYEQGDFPKSEKLFVETMKRAISSGTPVNDNVIVEIALKIATMSGLVGDHEKADQGFKFCINTQRKKIEGMGSGETETDALVKDTHLLLGLSLDNYGHYLLSRGRYSEAQQMWTDALSVSRKFLGPQHKQSLVIHSNLALVHERLGQVDKSVGILEEIVSLSEIQESEDLPIFLCNLGMNYITQKNFDKAEKVLAKARRLGEQSENQDLLETINEHLTILRAKKKEAS